MLKILYPLALLLGLTLLTGCVEDRKPDPPEKEGGIRIKAPGVDVDIQRKEQGGPDTEKRRKKIDVDIDVDR